MFDDLNSPKFIAQLKSGDRASFEKLATDLFVPLWKFLVTIQGVPEPDAEELAQDVLMKVYRNIGNFRVAGSAKPTTWIFQIANNLAIDFHRARRPASTEEQHTMPSFRGARIPVTIELLTWLKNELEKLDPDVQRILQWRVRDINYTEIGKWLEVKPATARVRYCRAIKKLQRAGREVANGFSDAAEEVAVGAAHR